MSVRMCVYEEDGGGGMNRIDGKQGLSCSSGSSVGLKLIYNFEETTAKQVLPEPIVHCPLIAYERKGNNTISLWKGLRALQGEPKRMPGWGIWDCMDAVSAEWEEGTRRNNQQEGRKHKR